MSYLKEFRSQIAERNTAKLLQLWEEYCTNDIVESKEFIKILKMIKNSPFQQEFGKLVETALYLWEKVEEPRDSYEIIKHLIDLQTTNSPILANTTYLVLENVYHNDPDFNNRVRLVGLRQKTSFQGAISSYELLAHMDKGKYVYHSGGWGVGEIMDISTIREMVTIEFENVAGLKHFSFINCFKTISPLASDSFLARRFGAPDLLESEARENPVNVLRLMLSDLGPKTASEVKDELCELVIPEADWSRWWQAARSKLKKDTLIEVPASLKDPFALREEEVTHEEEFQEALQSAVTPDAIIQTAYNFVRDFPSILKDEKSKSLMEKKLLDLFHQPVISKAQLLQIAIFLHNHFSVQEKNHSPINMIKEWEDLTSIICDIEVLAFKKRALILVRQNRKDWDEIFLEALDAIDQSQLRDYIVAELSKESCQKLKERLDRLLSYPIKSPEFLVWFFQKVTTKHKEEIPFDDKKGKCRALEAFLTLLHAIEQGPKKDLAKKMVQLLTNQRFAVVRTIIEGTSEEFLKEFLLLASKCHTLTNSDKKILHSLAAVVQPSLAEEKNEDEEQNILWTTEEGYRRTQERVKKIGTTDIVENAREIEVARAHGDLRENSEYKYALEKRTQLQAELKSLSTQLSHARILTKDDISRDKVGVGNVIHIKSEAGQSLTYTILGPWEANPDNNILSSQSQLAQQMIGLTSGDHFSFRGEEFTIIEIKSYL